jgi:hypothetical protein
LTAAGALRRYTYPCGTRGRGFTGACTRESSHRRGRHSP